MIEGRGDSCPFGPTGLRDGKLGTGPLDRGRFRHLPELSRPQQCLVGSGGQGMGPAHHAESPHPPAREHLQHLREFVAHLPSAQPSTLTLWCEKHLSASCSHSLLQRQKLSFLGWSATHLCWGPICKGEKNWLRTPLTCSANHFL